MYQDDESFKAYAEKLSEDIIRRDQEDGEKLAKGIQLAVDKGVLPADVEVEPTTSVCVSGKTADAVADEIITALGDAGSTGCVLILTGLSGTGKGTTVAKLKERLPNAQTWSNGNIFRSLTLLAVTWAEQQGVGLEEALKPEVLSELSGMLEFDEFNGKLDVKIEGLGLKLFVSETEKTVLKEPRVARNIPTVAEVTQGEVINFVGVALQKMAASGMNVLVEGREQTLNHIRSPHRFELVLADTNIIGMRQAALLMAGEAAKQLQTQVDGALAEALTTLSQ